MPALPNPGHEAYAQALFKGLTDGITQAQAYKAAGYLPTNSKCPCGSIPCDAAVKYS
jgi:hypothetical protein